MKKNGFTLVEILAVLVLIAAIAILAIPSITNYINKSKNEISDVTQKIIFTGVDLYISNNKQNFEENKYNQYVVSLQDIVDQGFLTAPIVDSVSGKEIELSKMIQINYRYDKDLQKFTSHYEIVDESTAKTFICVMKDDLNDDGFGKGDEYICNVGEGIENTFYMLEDGDNTSLELGDLNQVYNESEEIGSATDGEVALIMNENIGNMVKWCKSGCNNSCDANGPMEVLSELTSEWLVDTSLPTYHQIYNVTNSTQFGNLGVEWLKSNLYSDLGVSLPLGYWTRTKNSSVTNQAFRVTQAGKGIIQSINVCTENLAGVRPVITISKDSVYSYKKN